MSEMKNKVNLSAYKKEMKDVLERLVKTMPAYKELRFFCEMRYQSLSDRL